MRPIKLTMNAFGSFLETTIIDFEILNNAGFYLVTGETGSGKSILLDQILLQLINRYTSLEMEIIPIDTTGVELNYYAESEADLTLFLIIIFSVIDIILQNNNSGNLVNNRFSFFASCVCCV